MSWMTRASQTGAESVCGSDPSHPRSRVCMRQEGVSGAYLLDVTDRTKFARRALLPGFFTVMSSSLSLIAPPALDQCVIINWLMGRWVDG